MLFSFLFRGAKPTKASDRKRRKAPPLQVELLEDRSLLSAGYAFQTLAALGGDAPPPHAASDGTTFDFDFEPGQLNNRGQLAFGADLNKGAGDVGEGVFITDAAGNQTTLARTGDTSPDGQTYGPVFLGTASINDAGEGAFVIHRDGFDFPTLLARDAALYRYSPTTGLVTPEILPGDAAPGGGTFHGVNFRPVINDAGTIAFSGLIETNIGPGNPPDNPDPASQTGLGFGIFTVDAHHHVTKIMRPGDAAPGGKTFDFAQNPWINAKGDIAFGAHVAEDPTIQFGASFPAGNQIFAAESVYLFHKNTGKFEAIATQGGPAPGGGTFTYAFGPVMNNKGDIAYFGALDAGGGEALLPPHDNSGIFLYSHGKSIVVARPGDAMPGGGTMISAGFFTGELGLNEDGVVSFTATMDSDTNGDTFHDTGLFTWANGKLSLVARSGTVLPGIGTIRDLHPPDAQAFATTFSGAAINERGQIAFMAALTDGDGVLLLATPHGDKRDAAPKAAEASPVVTAAPKHASGLDHYFSALGESASPDWVSIAIALQKDADLRRGH